MGDFGGEPSLTWKFVTPLYEQNHRATRSLIFNILSFTLSSVQFWKVNYMVTLRIINVLYTGRSIIISQYIARYYRFNAETWVEWETSRP